MNYVQNLYTVTTDTRLLLLVRIHIHLHYAAILCYLNDISSAQKRVKYIILQFYTRIYINFKNDSCTKKNVTALSTVTIPMLSRDLQKF